MSMEDLSLHILDIAENAIRAGADRVEVKVVEAPGDDILMIEVSDNGAGMTDELRRKVFDPFVTTKEGRRVGLGLPMFAQSAREAGGECTVESAPGEGTRVRATFQYGHIDRRPLGNLQETFATLIAGNADIDFRFEYTTEDGSQVFDTSVAGRIGGPRAPGAGRGSPGLSP